MATQNDFLSRDNKELLWNVLYENNAFNGIPKENVGSIQNLFEKSLTSANTNGSDLITLNKDFISGFIQKIDSYKQRTVPLVREKKNEVNSQFANKQQEFTDLLNPKPPADISFSDADDQPLDNAKIDEMLQLTIRQRELDLEVPNAPTSNDGSHKWLSGENANMSGIAKNIKIGDELHDTENVVKLDQKPVKKVAWADEDIPKTGAEPANIQDNFFQKLKPNPKQEDNKKYVEVAEFVKLNDKLDKIHDLLEELIKNKDKTEE